MDVKEVQSVQGTRLSDKAPWETYGEEMQSKLSPELEDAIKRYEERRYEKQTQQQAEELARQKELSDKVSEQYQWLTPEEYEQLEPRVGHIIHSSVFIEMLRGLGVNCWYMPHMLPRRLTLVVKRNDRPEPEIACWLQEGFQVEYSWMKFDDHGVPLDERRRGWRTVLLQLILKGILTEQQADEVFGPATGPASERYNSLLYEFRNKRVKLKEEDE